MRKVLIILVPLIIGILLLREPIYRWLFSYEVVGERPIEAFAPMRSGSGSNDAIDRSLKTVSNLLHYSTGSVSTDPDILIKGGPANCIGYAALFARSIDVQLDPQRYKITHAIAKIHFLDHDLHLFMDDPFWKDHDIVIIEDLSTGEKSAVDPTLYDAVGIGRIKLKS